jgi:hypothetical protein
MFFQVISSKLNWPSNFLELAIGFHLIDHEVATIMHYCYISLDTSKGIVKAASFITGLMDLSTGNDKISDLSQALTL